MVERNWELVRILTEYLDSLFEKMRSNPGEVYRYDHGREQIEMLRATDIRRMAMAENAMEQMLIARASYKGFVVTSFLLNRKHDFGCSLYLLEDTAQKAVTRWLMPPRPKFVEKIFQHNPE